MSNKEIDPKIQLIINKGFTKEVIENMYRGESYLNQKKITAIVREQLDWVLQRHIKDLMAFYEIEVWSRAEQNKAQKLYPNKDILREQIDELSKLGYTSDVLQSKYDDGMTRNDLIKEINNTAKKNIVNRGKMKDIWEELSLTARTPQEVGRARIEKVNSGRSLLKIEKTNGSYGDGYTKEQLIDLYNSGASLEEIYKETKCYPYMVAGFLRDAGIEIRKPLTFKEIYSQLEDIGCGKDSIEKIYLGENISIVELGKRLGEKLNSAPIPETVMRRMLAWLEIKKSKELLAVGKGTPSRDTLRQNTEKLKSAGFDSVEELANYYNNNLHVTRYELLAQLNKNLSKDEHFTNRWLERHMDPLVISKRPHGTSRGELSLVAFVQTIYSGEIVVNDRKAIHPYELDIYLPELNLALEFNGNYWHSDAALTLNYNRTAVEYHTEKRERGKSRGIRILFVWESDWENKATDIRKAIKSALKGDSPEILSKLEWSY